MTHRDSTPPSANHLTETIRDAWALVVPVSCAGCGAPSRELCAECLDRLARRDGDTARALVRWSLADGTPGTAARPYDALLGAVLLACKEDARVGLLGPLAAVLEPALDVALREAIVCTAGRAPEIATVPASRRAARTRGFHPVERLVRRLGQRPVRPLRWSREPSDQRDFGRAQRFANLAGALRAPRPLDGRRFLLVEDVVTTGATAGESVRAIRAAGGAVLGVVALARVMP
ncbi:ComF family protein [Plantibacter flavus]|uniref:ComF family protein n=1 Tax=Plantibacter flavus TaxID=150123 RepID=UPI003F14911D